MRIAFATIAIFWWIAIWGVSDVLTHNWSDEEKLTLYISIIVIISIIVLIKPSIIEHI